MPPIQRPFRARIAAARVGERHLGPGQRQPDGSRLRAAPGKAHGHGVRAHQKAPIEEVRRAVGGDERVAVPAERPRHAALRVAEDEQRIARLNGKARACFLRDDDLPALADLDGTENILALRQT